MSQKTYFELEDVFKGVFSSDEIETLDNDFPAAYVFNTKPDSHPDGHRVAVNIDDNGFTNYLNS